MRLKETNGEVSKFLSGQHRTRVPVNGVGSPPTTTRLVHCCRSNGRSTAAWWWMFIMVLILSTTSLSIYLQMMHIIKDVTSLEWNSKANAAFIEDSQKTTNSRRVVNHHHEEEDEEEETIKASHKQQSLGDGAQHVLEGETLSILPGEDNNKRQPLVVLEDKNDPSKPVITIPHPLQQKPPPPPTTTTTKDFNYVLSNNNKTILIWTTMAGFNRKEPCDIPCEYTTHESRRTQADASVYERRGYSPPKINDTFSIYMQMEGSHYYPIRLDGYQLENTYNWRSPLLKPYFEWVHYNGKYNIQNPPVPFHGTIPGATFIARNCHSRNNREGLVEELRQLGIRVDGLSSCLRSSNSNHSKTIIPSHDKLAMMKPYLFNLAFENGNVEDYVTEKVYQALASGVVPIYTGAPNIRDYVPDGSIIHVGDFNSTASLTEHLKHCMTNESLYNEYHAWRFRPLPLWFEQRFNFTTATTECRTCRYIYALQNGLDWDKERQVPIPPR